MLLSTSMFCDSVIHVCMTESQGNTIQYSTVEMLYIRVRAEWVILQVRRFWSLSPCRQLSASSYCCLVSATWRGKHTAEMHQNTTTVLS